MCTSRSGVRCLCVCSNRSTLVPVVTGGLCTVRIAVTRLCRVLERELGRVAVQAIRPYGHDVVRSVFG